MIGWIIEHVFFFAAGAGTLKYKQFKKRHRS